MFKKTTAAREQVKLKIGVAGPSGSGKTYSSLQLAYGITGDWTKVALADTENGSANYYAGETTGPWQHIPFEGKPENGGYSPNNYAKLIDFCDADPSIEVLVIDSISHEWEGIGGCLHLVEQIGKGFNGWKDVTPMHNRFMNKLLHSRLHIIATMRTKSEFVVEQNEKGKATPRKVGTKTVQRDGVDFEFGVILDIEVPSHFATANKDRTGLFANRGPFLITPDVGKELLEWANSGVAPVTTMATSSTYEATATQKTAFAKLCVELGVSDKVVMATLSEKALGLPTSELRSFVTANV